MNQNFIGGAWKSSAQASRNINPSNTDDVVGEFSTASASDVDDAVSAATKAFKAWSHSTPQTRHDILKRVGDELALRRDELGRLLSREEGKIVSEGVGEVLRASQIFLFFAQECLRIPGEKMNSVRPNIEIEITREPLGVIGIITPWNYPIGIPAWKIAPALAYGNCVIFKPADLVPALAHALTAIVAKAGIPDGVLNLVMGRGSVVGERMLKSADIAGISFTGSVPTGRKVAATCVQSMKKCQLEMGGKNPLVVLDDADLDVAVDCAINGAFFSTGQRCTASSRIIVTEGVYSKFIELMADRARALVIGDALDPRSQLGPVVDQSQFDQNQSYLEIGRSEGASLVCGGEPLRRTTPGYYFGPAIFGDVSPKMRIAREEIFGPIAAVIPVKDYDEALTVSNDTEFGLCAGICTRSLKYATHFRRNADVGMVMVNLPTAGVDYHVPFGGRKASSYGPREQGRYAAEFFTTVKTAYCNAG